MFAKMVILTGSLLALLSFYASAEAPDLQDLEAGIREHVRSYDGLEFSITSSLYQEDSERKKTNSLPDLRETVRLHFPTKGPAWKYWVQEIQDKFDGQWIVNSFKVTNVSKTHNFTFFPEQEGQWSRGDATPWHEWYDEQNGRQFFTFLGLNTVGLSLLRFDVPDALWNKSVKRFNLQFVKEEQLGTQKQWVFQGSDHDAAIRLCVLYPQNMVIRWEAFIGKKCMMSYIVEDVGIFEGICYPRKGKLHRDHMGPTDKMDYGFEVTNVCRYSSELLKHWFPEWPPGTDVHDVGTDKSTRIPPTERQLEKITKMRGSHEITPISTTRTVVRITLMSAGLALILYALYRMQQKKQ